MKFTIIIKILILLLIPLTIFAETNLKDDQSKINYEKQKAKVDWLNKQSVKYFRYDFPKAIKAAESALKIAKDINYPQGEADALINCGNSMINSSSVDPIIHNYKKALKIYRKIDDTSKIAQTLNQLSFNYYNLQNYTEAYNNALEANGIFDGLSDKEGMAYSYYLIGRIYYNWNMTNHAEDALKYSKTLYKEVKDYSGVADVLTLQAEISGTHGDNNRAKRLYFNAVYLSKKAGDLAKLGEIYKKLAGYYSDNEKDLNKAFNSLNKAIEIAQKMKDSTQLASYLNHKGHLYSLKGDNLKNLEYDLKALTIREKIGQTLATGSSHINVGSDYLFLKDYKNAEKHLLIGFRISKDGGVKYFARRAAHLLHGLYRMENKPDKALLYLDSAYKLTKDIYENEQKHQESLIKIERKLRFEENKFRTYTEKKDANQKLLLLIIMVLSIFASFLFFFQYRTKKKDNQKLTIKTKELEASEFRYRNLIETATDFIYSIDSNGCFISINPAFETLTGYLVADYIGKNFEKLVYKDDLNLAITTFEKSKKGMPQEPYILRILKKTGDYFYGEFTSKELVQDGRIIGEFGIVRDITAKKIAEDALKASEERYRVFINSTDDMAFLKDDKFRYLIVNNPYVEFFAKPEKYILGKTDFELMPLTAAESCNKTDQLAAKSNSVVVNEEEAFGRIYETHKFRVSLDNELYGIGGYIRDITERKNAEAALKKSEKRYSTLITTMNEGLIQVDNEDRILFVNKGICNIFGYQPEELIGKIGYETIIYPDDRNIIESENKSRLAGNTEQYEVRGIKKSGEIIWLSISGSPILDELGNTIGSVGLISDITDRKIAENELIASKLKAEESERLKSSFLANMSHELRTPMVGILGFSQLLADVENLEKAKEMGEVINSSGKRLMETLNLILDLARIEAGESEVEIYEIDLIDAINEVIIVFDVIAKTKNIVLKSVSDFEHKIIYTSPKIIASVLNNLINNAVKFTNAGSIIVTLEDEIIDGQTYAIIKVADTGIGIDNKNLADIFDEFRQASEGLGRSHEGTGLGLTLCKKYVEMLGGNISVESTLGVGTIFTIRIPDMNTSNIDESIDIMQSEPKISVKAPQSPKDFNYRILVVDDDQTSVYLVERILGNQFFIDSVNNSADAIEKVKDNQYALILMDINLGKSKNGLYATGEIRKLENYRNIPIIAMTAYAMMGDKEEFISKGCTGYISKPYTKEQLFNLVLEYI